MNELKNKLRNLKLKKVMLFSDIEALSEVEESMFTQLGKIEAEILKVRKAIVCMTENIIG